MLALAPFGTTGHQSTRVIFGAAALGGMSQARAEATIEEVHTAGVNHFDTAASYGASEDRMHDWLQDHRGQIFLATKTGERTGSAARAQLERSLERLGVAHVDLIQLHNLVEEDEWQTAHGPGGAVEALFQARDEGLCRHVGVTGHGLRIPRMHLRSLAEAPFASVLYPWNHNLAVLDTYAADVADLTTHGMAHIAAVGGKPGLGNCITLGSAHRMRCALCSLTHSHTHNRVNARTRASGPRAAPRG